MKILLQRAQNVQVFLDGKKKCEFQIGVVCFVGFHKDDQEDGLAWAIRKLLSLLLWNSDDGKPWKKCISDVDGGILLVHDSYMNASVETPNSPTLENAMSEQLSKIWYDKLIQKISCQYKLDHVFAQPFGEKLKIDFFNDGPLTIIIDSFNRK